MPDLILHHYDFSNYSEKARVAPGYKSLERSSVTVPPSRIAPEFTLKQVAKMIPSLGLQS